MLAGVIIRHERKFDRLLYIAAWVSCNIIVAASSSSTPLLGSLVGLLFWSCWPIRRYVKYGFLAAPFILFCLHFVMEAPVWHLISRVSAVSGSTSYHRYVLIDSAITHFHEWWFVGCTSTAHWSENYQTWDITNQYIFEGVRGGVFRLLAFSATIYFVCRSFGQAQSRSGRSRDELLLWGWGASMVVHCVCFIGVSYFGQTQYLWFLTLGLGGSLGDRKFVYRRKEGATDDDVEEFEEFED
jgi:phosphotransferase system  glucose/maltose/N-acetylglucosamine-specific IIC component